MNSAPTSGVWICSDSLLYTLKTSLVQCSSLVLSKFLVFRFHWTLTFFDDSIDFLKEIYICCYVCINIFWYIYTVMQSYKMHTHHIKRMKWTHTITWKIKHLNVTVIMVMHILSTRKSPIKIRSINSTWSCATIYQCLSHKLINLQK